MAKNFNPRTAESLFKQKLRTMIGSTAHTQNIADQAMELAVQDFRIGVPGMGLQVAGGYLLLKYSLQ